jgi:predicted DNA-binding protein (MmcQ/YjbR family)
MNIDWVRQYCLSLPHATEQVQFGNHLVFKIGGKMFAILSLEAGPNWLSLKCDPSEFGEVTEQPGVIPAPYLARAQWAALESDDSLPRAEVKRLLRTAYDTVLSKLPKKTRAALAG